MQLSAIDWTLWAAGFLGHAAVLFALWRKGGWRSFPWFTAWIVAGLLRTTTLFMLHKHGQTNLYSKVYWYGQLPELLLQLGVVWDLARALLRPQGRWMYGTRRLAVVGAIIAVIFALGLTWTAAPTAPTSLWSFLIRGNLFSVALVSELALAVIVTAQYFGLAWRHWVFGLAAGWMVLCLVTFGVEAAHSYFGYGKLYHSLVHVRMYAELIAFAVWIVVFSRPQPVVRPISPELLNALERWQLRSTDASA